MYIYFWKKFSSSSKLNTFFGVISISSLFFADLVFQSCGLKWDGVTKKKNSGQNKKCSISLVFIYCFHTPHITVTLLNTVMEVFTIQENYLKKENKEKENHPCLNVKKA